MDSENFTPKYKLVDASDLNLRQELPKFDFSDPPIDPISFAHDLVQHMLYYGGIGLAANQLGFEHRVFAIKANPVLVCYNPIIIDMTTEHVLLEEGCLTFPNVFLKVSRPKSVRIRYQEPNGEYKTQSFTGLSARIVQHEYDHLEGVLFIDYVSKLKLDMAFKKARKHKAEYKHQLSYSEAAKIETMINEGKNRN